MSSDSEGVIEFRAVAEIILGVAAGGGYVAAGSVSKSPRGIADFRPSCYRQARVLLDHRILLRTQ